MGAYELIKGDDPPSPPASPPGGGAAASVVIDIEEGGGGELRIAAASRSAALDQSGTDAADDEEEPSASKRKASSPQQNQKKKPPRLVSLDVFRGVTVVLMILVDDAGGIFPAISHSPWNGITLADFVMPFFLFIVGVALGLVYKRIPNKVVATRKAILRALKLFVLGLVLQGGYFHGVNNLTFGVDISRIRIMGILQRISIAYIVAALCEIWLQADDDVDSGSSLMRKYRYQLLVASILTAIYLVLLYGVYVPDWTYQIASKNTELKTFQVKCGTRGDTGPGCNTVGFIDRKILGIPHIYKKPAFLRSEQCSINSPELGPLPADAPSWCQAPFDPEGLASSIMAIVTCLIGLQFGHVIVHFKDHKDRIVNWMFPSFCLLAAAFMMDLVGMHMNKALYSVSYTFATTGAAGVLFTGFYVLVDVYGLRQPTIIMEWMGMHALMIFVLVACNILPILVQGFYWKEPRNNILSLIGVGSS